MAAGSYSAACEKFAASQKLDVGLGTTLNLGDCYEKLGRTASAWAEYRDAAATARRIGSKDREQVARDRAAALEKKLARLTLSESRPRPEQRITRDGVAVDRAIIGTPVPVDPGRHVLEVAGPGKKKWSVVVDLRPGEQLAVAIPELEAEPLTPVAHRDSPAAAHESPKADDNGGTQRAVAIGVAGVGVVGLAVGTIFGLKAKANWADAKDHCTSYPYGCGADGVALGNRASSAATVASVSFAVGVVGLAGATVLWFTAPTDHPPQSGRDHPLRVGFDGQQLLLRGTFE